MKTRLLVVALLCFSCTSIISQITFVRTYGPAVGQGQSGYAVKQCNDGGYIACGYNHPSAQYNFYVVRIDSLGDTLWTKTIGGDNMVGFDVIQTSDSGFLVSGYKNSSNPYMQFEKLDAAGNSMWSRSVMLGWGQCVQQTFDGGYASAGSTLVKTDSAGTAQWSRNLSFQAMYLVQLADSGYIVSGFLTDSIILSRRDAAGNVVWQKSYAGTMYNTYNPCNNNVSPTSDGGYIVSGMVSTSNHTQLLIKTDANGDTLWTRQLPGQEAEGVVQTNDGGYAVGGWDNLDDDMMLVKTDANGIVQWSHHYDNMGNSDWTQSLQQTTDHGYILAGTSFISSAGSGHLLLIKTDSNGYFTGMNVAEYPNEISANVFPNPCTDKAILKFSKPLDDASVNMYDAQGKLVRTDSHVQGESYELQRDGLDAGMYHVIISQSGRTISAAKIVFSD